MKVNTIIDYYEHQLDHKFSETLIKKLKGEVDSPLRHLDDWDEFFQGMLNFLENQEVLSRNGFEIRPLIGYTFNNSDNILFWLEEDVAQINFIKNTLMYYHRVCFVLHTEFFFELWTKENAIKFAEFLLPLKELIQDRSINFIAETHLYNVTPEFSEDYSNLLEQLGFNPGIISLDSESKIIHDLNGCYRYDYDYLTSQPKVWQTIKASGFTLDKSELKADSDHLLSSSILRFESPKLNNIEICDVLSLRRNNDAFHDWRKILNEILFEISCINLGDVQNFNREVDYIFRHKIAEKKASLQSELKKIGLLSHLKDNSLKLTISIIGMLLASTQIDVEYQKKIITYLFGTSGLASFIDFGLKESDRNKTARLIKYLSLYEEC